MSLCLQRKNIPLGEAGPKGYFQLFRTNYKIPTSLGNESKEGILFMFTLSGHSFLFHKDILNNYLVNEENFFSKGEDDTNINCCFCNENNSYSLVTFYKLSSPNVEEQLEDKSLKSILHARDRKPLCDSCMSEIFETTLRQIDEDSEKYTSKLI